MQINNFLFVLNSVYANIRNVGHFKTEQKKYIYIITITPQYIQKLPTIVGEKRTGRGYAHVSKVSYTYYVFSYCQMAF